MQNPGSKSISHEKLRSHLLEARNSLDLLLANDAILDNLSKAVDIIVTCLSEGNKVITCGNGGSMTDAMHLAEELSGKFRNDRKALAALALSDPGYLSCVGNDYGYEMVFSRGIEALGNAGDVLVCFSTSGNSSNVLFAVETARKLGLGVIAFTGKDGGKLGPMADVELRAPMSHYADRAQEIHTVLMHALIDGVELGLGLAN